jgi:NAD-dependent dihydropyrimidine dehydrogenase PreA subunit
MGRKPLIQPSTKAFVREGKLIKGYSWVDLLHGYIYARWPYFYIAMGTGNHPLSKRLTPIINLLGKWITSNSTKDNATEQVLFEDTYHGKVVPLEAAKQLVSVNEDIALGDLEKIIPYARARDIIFKNPDHIVVLDCPCRLAREHPCLPLDVCLIIGEPFASFVIEHHPERSRWITAQEAQEILKAEDERGHVHHAFFKDAMLERFYAICNCCSCCCGAMQAQRNGTFMLASSGFVAKVDQERCQACGTCEEACQFSAISINGHAEIDLDKCMGCGVCVSQCLQEALELVRMESKGEPLQIYDLINQRSDNK